MAEFLEIVRQVDRMRKRYKRYEMREIIGEECGVRQVTHNVFDMMPTLTQAKTIEKYVSHWAANHPEKTMEDVLFEKFPQAQRLPNGRIRICPHMLNPAWKNDQCVHGESNCRECWRRPVEE